MAFGISSPVIGAQAINETSTVQKHPLGTVIKAVDPTYGEGEFIYLLGVTSTIVGSVVSYDVNFQSALHTSDTTTPRPVAVAMSENVGSYYGWYQIGGLSLWAKNTGTSLAAATVLRASAGFAVAAATGTCVMGALVAVVASAKSLTVPGTVTVMINRPHAAHDVS